MSDKNVLPLPPAYHDLAQFLFMLEMSYMNPSQHNAVELRRKIDSLIAVIHAQNVIERVVL